MQPSCPDLSSSSRPREGGSLRSADSTVQSTFESNPSKSVADFPAVEPFGPSTSAATSELEAKLRQRMLKCEGSDVLYRPQSAKSREKSASRTPARLTHSILKKNMEILEPSKAQPLTVQDSSKVEELVETASYQRCTKARARSAHSLTRANKKKDRAPAEGSDTQGDDGGMPSGLHSRAQVRSLSAKAGSSKATPEVAPEVAPEVQRGTLALEDKNQSFLDQPEQLLTPRSGCESSAMISNYDSVASQDEFFELGENGCATFALDDPMRDAMEEAGDDVGSPRMLDSENGDEDPHVAHEGDISIEECLFDLVNHIPSHLAQKIGLVLQKLEEVKSGVPGHRALEDDEDGMQEMALEGEGESLEGDKLALEAGQSTDLLGPAPETGHPKPGKQEGLLGLHLHKRDCAECKQRQRQLLQHQESAKVMEELLEQRMHSEAAAASIEAKTLSDELSESRKEEDQLGQTKRESDKRLEMQKMKAMAELEVLRTALAGADTRLIDAGARLQLSEQHRDKLRNEVLSSETELIALRESVMRAEERLQLTEQQKNLFRAEVEEGEEAQVQLECEVRAMSLRNEETQALLQTETASAADKDEMVSILAELQVLKQKHAETCKQLAASEKSQARLQKEAAESEATRVHLQAEVYAVVTKEEKSRSAMETEMTSALVTAESLVESRTAQVHKMHKELDEYQASKRQADELRSELESEREALDKFKKESKKHEEELRTMALRAMKEAEDLHRLTAIANESREQSRRHEEILHSEKASVIQERDHMRQELERERIMIEEERAMGAALHDKNKDLKEDWEKLCAQTIRQQRLLQERETGVAEAEGVLQIRNEREIQVYNRYEEDCQALEREASELRREQEKCRELQAEHLGRLADKKTLSQTLVFKDMELQEERQMQDYYMSRSEFEQTECSLLQKHLESERLKLQDETVRRVYLERVTANLTGEKEALSSRYAAAVAEIGVFREQEGQLDCQMASLRRTLMREQQELQAEQDLRKRLVAENEMMEASKAQIEARLESETHRLREVREAAASMILYDNQPPVWGDSPASRNPNPRLTRERERFDKGANRVVQLEEVCRAADAEVAAQAKAMRLNESLRRQLCAETKFAVHEAEELRIAMDARAAAQSEELREAEVRREQLEAETSLMAMEVATLSKDLGGRLLEDGALGLTRRPFTIHDILREAWRSGTIPGEQSYRVQAVADERQRGKAARDAYFVNLYLKWLRRGPYRHRLHISGIPSYHNAPPPPRSLPSSVPRGGVPKGLTNLPSSSGKR